LHFKNQALAMNQLIAIALGGSAGAVTRFLVANGVYGWLGRDFPHGTLFVNVSGSFLMGLLTELLLQRFAVAAEYRAAILVGFLGAFTTFSSFALETLYLLQEGSLLKAFLNILFSTLLCVGAVWIGLVWGRTLFTGAGPFWNGQGLAYLGLVLGWITAFLVVLLATILFHYLVWPASWRAVALILMLGGVTVVSTLWTSFRLTEVRLELGGLFTVFTLNGLCAAAVLWLATHAGNWLWQLNPSR
jgi:CrcB protein